MRDIKFRAKAIGSGRWLYGDLVWTGSQRSEPHIIEDWSADEDSATSVDEHTLGMNLGMYDKNHKEIFLGDIIASNGKTIGYVADLEDTPCPMLTTIEDNFRFHEPVVTLYWRNEDIEIVGKIYDNPELMKGDNNERTHNNNKRIRIQQNCKSRIKKRAFSTYGDAKGE